MRRKFYLIASLLFVATSLYADPIDVTSLPPQPEVLGALLIEVLVVAALIWRFRLRTVRFIVTWYAVNLLTFYVLLQAIAALLHSVIIGEFMVFTAEAIALFGLSRLQFFKSVDSKPIPFGWAIAGSVAGNLSSIFGYIAIMLVVPPRDHLPPALRAQLMISDLSSAVDLYTLDTGTPPAMTKGLEALITDPCVSGWHGPYLRPAVLRKDPWGTPLRYRSVGTNFVIRSAGPDRKFDTPDDI